MSAEQLIEFLGKNYILIVVSMFLLFAVAEMIIPLNKGGRSVTFRWFTNISVVLIIGFIFKLGGPAFALMTAWLTEVFGLGLFNNFSLSLGLVMLFGIVLFDFKQYLFHRMMHYFDVLWLVHRVHHSDIEVDLTTGFRFHPLESILSSFFDVVVIVVFGIPPETLLLRYMLIYLVNFFTHADIRIPSKLDHYLKSILITPSLHHLHHALDMRASNHNFGVIFSFWDRIFGTFMIDHPESGQEIDVRGIDYGLRDYREPGKLNLALLMMMPFKKSQASQEESLNA